MIGGYKLMDRSGVLKADLGEIQDQERRLSGEKERILAELGTIKKN